VGREDGGSLDVEIYRLAKGFPPTAAGTHAGTKKVAPANLGMVRGRHLAQVLPIVWIYGLMGSSTRSMTCAMPLEACTSATITFGSSNFVALSSR